MIELEFSVMARTVPSFQECMQDILEQFTQASGIRVHLKLMDWSTGQSELTRTALYHHGPDVSEIGTTWVGDLIGMNALRPYLAHEMQPIARPEEFIASAYKTSQVTGNKQVWAMPWFSEPFLIHYRRDIFERAGVDERAAFRSHHDLDETFQKLQQAGVPIPADVPLSPANFPVMHALASWVWASGGDFCSPEGRRVLFAEPETLAAIRLFFKQMTYISMEGKESLKRGAGAFAQGESAMFYSSFSAYPWALDPSDPLRKNWGIATFPGAYFVGGSNLVTWKHSNDDQAALALVRYLTSPETLVRICALNNTFPARQSIVYQPGYHADPVLDYGAQATLNGRTYPPVPMWGMIEHRLVDTINRVINDYYSDPTLDLDAHVTRSFETLARRLNVTLSI